MVTTDDTDNRKKEQFTAAIECKSFETRVQFNKVGTTCKCKLSEKKQHPYNRSAVSIEGHEQTNDNLKQIQNKTD